MTLNQREKYNLLRNAAAFLQTVSPYLDDLMIKSETLTGDKKRCNDGGELAELFASELLEVADDYV